MILQLDAPKRAENLQSQLLAIQSRAFDPGPHLTLQIALSERDRQLCFRVL